MFVMIALEGKDEQWWWAIPVELFMFSLYFGASLVLCYVFINVFRENIEGKPLLCITVCLINLTAAHSTTAISDFLFSFSYHRFLINLFKMVQSR